MIKSVATVLFLVGRAMAEAPQEHSHEAVLLATQAMLELNNPLEINNTVFGLLGDAAAAGGAGKVTNLACLQQNTADQAFTNAKAAGDVDGMAAALMYRALERNTTPVGGASALCNETAANPEVQAITQHQDPASAEAAAGVNRDVTLALATQLQAVGADPNLAIQTGTFPAGTIGDPTGDGFICDDADDTVGCILTTGMLVADVTEDEIVAHLAGTNADANANANATVVVAQAADGDLQQLADLALAVNQTKIDGDLQGEANAKGSIFTLGAQIAAAHPNNAAAKAAIAAAFAANSSVPPQVNADTICQTAVAQTNQVSGQGNTLLVVGDAVPACVAAQ